MRIQNGTLAALTLLAFVAPACGKASPSAPAGNGSTVSVDLKEYSITPDVTHVQAGTVTFTVKNSGTIQHEFVVLKTDLAAGSVPMTGLKADEAAPGVSNVGEIAEFDAGKTVTKTLDLTAGKYVFVCNIEGHYTSGMRRGFEVT